MGGNDSSLETQEAIVEHSPEKSPGRGKSGVSNLLLIEYRNDQLEKSNRKWPSPLSEDALYSLFSENQLLIEQD